MNDILAPQQPSTREFDDTNALRERIFEGVKTAYGARYPLTNKRHRLELSDLEYKDTGKTDFAAQKKAIIGGRTLHRPLHGTWRLYDNETNELIDERPNSRVAMVPHITERGTFISNGTEYTLANQMRLKPGVYARKKDNGELESHFNMLPGTGSSFRLFMDPETGVFNMKVGQSKIPLYTMLRTLGVKDAQMANVWGRDLLAANQLKDNPKHFDKAYEKFMRRRAALGVGEREPGDVENMVTEMHEMFDKMRLDPMVTKDTLGKPYDRVTPDVLLAATNKLISISRGEAETDDRDNISYQNILGPEELISERIAKDAGMAARTALWKATWRNSLDPVVNTDARTRQIQGVLTESGLGQAIEEVNPLDIQDQLTRISRMGAGGIPSMDSIPEEARSVQPSYLCYDDDTMVLTAVGWKPWSEVNLNTELACRINSQTCFKRPTAVIHQRYQGEMCGLESKLLNYLVTPNHRMFVTTAKSSCKWRVETAEQIYGKRRRFMISAGILDRGHDSVEFCIPHPGLGVGKKCGMTPNGGISVSMSVWLKFLGWYLSEGYCDYRIADGDVTNSQFRIMISQSNSYNPKKCTEIAEVLGKLPFKYCYHQSNKAFVINSKHLASYLRKFGKSYEKFIPRYVFSQSVAARQGCLDALLNGDGRQETKACNVYVTTSRQLALDVHELAISLGATARINLMDSPSHLTNANHKLRWRVSISFAGKSTAVCRDKKQLDAFAANYGRWRGHYKTQYDGMIHCAQIAGGLLYVMRDGRPMWSGNSYIDPVRTPESGKAGVEGNLAYNTLKGDDGQLYTRMMTRAGNMRLVPSSRAAHSIISFPGELERAKREGRKPRAMVRGRMQLVEPEQVTYEVPSHEDMLSAPAHLVPFVSAIKGHRMMMASKMLQQSLALRDGEAPLVQTRRVNDKDADDSFEKYFGGKAGAVRADTDGIVKKVTNDAITIKTADGDKEYKLYHNFPFNRKCVAGSTRLLIQRANGEMWGGTAEEYTFISGDTTPSVDKTTGVIWWKQVDNFVSLPCDKLMYRVTLASGRSLDVTEDHSLVSLTDKGLEKLIPAEVVVGKTYIPYPRQLVVDNEIPLPKELQALSKLEAGQLLGIYAAEGCPAEGRGSGSIYIAASEPDIISSVIAIGHKLKLTATHRPRPQQKPHHNPNTGVIYIGSSKKIVDWIKSMCGHGAHKKFVNPRALQYGSEFLHGFLGAYISGDGSAWYDANGAAQIEFASVSRDLRDGVIQCAEAIGLFTTTRERANEHGPIYYGRLRSETVSQLRGWLSLRKQEIAQNTKTTRTYDVVPLPTSLKSQYYQSIAETGVVQQKHYHCGNRGRVPVRDVAHIPFFAKWSEQLRWDRVVKLEEIDSVSIVYDISVGDSTFLANGRFVHNSYIHNTPVVRVGQQVKNGAALAKSNFTDNEGNLALGRNLRIGYLPYKGMTYEDAIVISEAASKKLTSEHMYQHDMDIDPMQKVSKAAYITKYPTKYAKAIIDNFDDNGVVREGTVVRKDDPLILGITKRKHKGQGVLHRSAKDMWMDSSETWKHDVDGIVTDVHRGPRTINVVVKSYHPSQVGDKISNRFASKGVISQIVPDAKMPQDADGNPLEILVHPYGIISRTNPALMLETALGKVAAKRGKPYKVDGFSDEDFVKFVEQELKKYGLSDTEDVLDPETNRKIKDVFVGNQFWTKMHHTAESKLGARGDEAGYTADMLPGKGGGESAKRIGGMETSSLLSHGACFLGATNVITEDGPLEISKIVKQRLSVNVLSLDEKTGKFEYKRVTNWFCKSVPPGDIVKITTTARTGVTGIRGSHRAIKCTRGHELLTANGKTQAGHLTQGDELLTVGTRVTRWQYELMCGTMMGDGYITRRKTGGLAVSRGHKQRDYLDWMFGKLKNLGSSSPKRESSIPKDSFRNHRSSRFTLRHHPIFKQLRKKFYTDKEKHPPVGIVKEMGWLGLGIWFADAGSVCCHGGEESGSKTTAYRLTTQGFSIDEAKVLANELANFTGLSEWNVTETVKNQPVVYLGNGGRGGDQLDKFADMLGPYLPPMMGYKLGNRGNKTTVGDAWKDLTPPTELFAEACSVTTINPYTLAKYEDSLVYNITVEDNHNYVVHGVVVGNTAILRDAKLVRGQRNDDFWRAFRMGYPPPTPDVPFVYKKFFADLQGAGVNVTKKGNYVHIMAMTDKDVDKIARGKITNKEMLDFDTMNPIPNGIFDMGMTGGHGGLGWTAIHLSEPMPNPVMEDPIRRLLGLTKNKFRAVLSGREDISGLKGGRGIKQALQRINVDKMLEAQKELIKTGSASKRDDAIKKLRTLTMLKETGIKPQELVMTKVPVLPPQYRPIAKIGKLPMISDPNYLYKELMSADENLSDLRGDLDDADVGDERLAVYDSFKALTGLADPLQATLQQKHVRGILSHAIGMGGVSPKHSAFQRKVIGTSTDLVGRGVITPNASLDMDQVGLPEEKAWLLYRPFIVRDLVRRGVKATVAAKMVSERDPRAYEALTREMKTRPVIINRAPTLHRFGIMAAYPVISKGHTLQVSPLTTSGFNADFDGDAQQFHVPVSDDAVREAKDKLLPSRNLTDVRFFDVNYVPGQEFLHGLYEASSSNSGKPVRMFRSKKDVLLAYKRGEINISDNVKIIGQ